MSIPRPTLVAPPERKEDLEWLEDEDSVDYGEERGAGLSSDDDSGVDDVRKSPVKRRRSRHFKLSIFKFSYSRKKT